jgi:hypothetical protein
LLAKASKAFEVHQDAQQDARLAREKTRFKTLVGELTRELKKATNGWDEPAPVTLRRPTS